MVHAELFRTEALVIGGGLAGVRATSALAEAGTSATLVCSGRFPSGASFYPGTWGLGMVAPRGDAEKEDLVEEIGRVGLGLNKPELTRTLAERAAAEIARLEAIGVNLRKSAEPGGVVPCFGAKRMAWSGFDFASAREAFGAMRDLENLRIMENAELLGLRDAGPGSKAALLRGSDGAPFVVAAKAIIIASGGFTTLWGHSFARESRTALAQEFAARLGCRFVNLEFVQFIPAHLEPALRTIFNERAFSRVRLEDGEGRALFADDPAAPELLRERSTHGPFTTRLLSRAVDFAMFDARSRGGVFVSYPEEIDREPDTLIREYFAWFRARMGGKLPGRIGILHFAHACNGGIEIDRRGRTCVEGVFACGEAAGGVHGADRIGGLSTVSALVFGAEAGRAAAEYCAGVDPSDAAALQAMEAPAARETGQATDAGAAGERAADAGGRARDRARGEAVLDGILRRLGAAMDEGASIVRSGAGLGRLEAALDGLESEGEAAGLGAADAIRMESRISFARAVVRAMRARTGAWGCHNNIGQGEIRP